MQTCLRLGGRQGFCGHRHGIGGRGRALLGLPWWGKALYRASPLPPLPAAPPRAVPLSPDPLPPTDTAPSLWTDLGWDSFQTPCLSSARQEEWVRMAEWAWPCREVAVRG